MKDKSAETTPHTLVVLPNLSCRVFAVRYGILAIMYSYFSDVNRAIELLEKLQQSKQINWWVSNICHNMFVLRSVESMKFSIIPWALHVISNKNNDHISRNFSSQSKKIFFIFFVKVGKWFFAGNNRGMLIRRGGVCFARINEFTGHFP